MITFKRLQSKDILVVCENTDHAFFTELNTANNMRLISLTPESILEDVGIAAMHLYEDPDESFPKELFICLDPHGLVGFQLEAIFQLTNLGVKSYHGKHDKVVFSYSFKGVNFDGDYYKLDVDEELSEVMITMTGAKV